MKQEIFTFLFLLSVIVLTSCDVKKDFEVNQKTDSGETPEEKYEGTKQFMDDYTRFLDMMVAAEQFKVTFFIAGYNESTKEPFGKEAMSRADIDALYSQMTMMAEMYDNNQEAVQRLADNGLLGLPVTRGIVGAIYKCLSFFGICKDAGTDARKTVLGIFSKIPEAECRKLYDDIKPQLRKGAKNYEDWIKLLGSGEIDYAGNEIFKDFYFQSQSYSTEFGAFVTECHKMDITPENRAYERATELWEAGANLVTAVLTSTAKFPTGVNVDNIKGLLNGEETIRVGIGINVGVTGTAFASNVATKLLSKDKSGTDAAKEKKRKALEEASKNFYLNYKNGGRTTVGVKNDMTGATSMVVASKKRDLVSVGIGGEDGKLAAVVPSESDEDCCVSLVGDLNGRMAQDMTVKAGQENVVAQKQYINVSKTDLKFASKGGTEALTMDMKGFKYYGGKIEEESAKEWLTVSSPSQTECVVTVKKNTGKERTAHILIFATNEKNPTDLYGNGVVKVRVTVTQTAAGYSLSSVLVTESIWVKDANNSNASEKQQPETMTWAEETAQTMKLGSDMHVTVDETVNKSGKSEKMTLSFDIANALVNGKVDFSNSKLNGLSYQHNNSDDNTGNWLTHTIKASNIPVVSVKEYGGYCIVKWQGTWSEGVDFSNYQYIERNRITEGYELNYDLRMQTNDGNIITVEANIHYD